MPRRTRLQLPNVPQHINRVYARSGTRWEGRYKASLVDTEPYFLRCCLYIEINPVRAQMVDDPAHYRRSSYSHHAHGVTDLLLLQHEQYARLGFTDETRQSAYRALFHTQALSEIRDTVANDGGLPFPFVFERQHEMQYGRPS